MYNIICVIPPCLNLFVRGTVKISLIESPIKSYGESYKVLSKLSPDWH